MLFGLYPLKLMLVLLWESETLTKTLCPLQAWVAVEKKGLVICGLCNCMAGLGEACSHVAALLFLLDSNTHQKKNLSCTSQPCYWLPPTLKNVPFAKICDIDFTSPKRKHRDLL